MNKEENRALEQAKSIIDQKLAADGRVVCALEGGAATGKSTLAAQLSALYQAPVIAMDDFFLPPALRTEHRLAEVGGNIDYERFNREVADPLRAGRAFSYSVYNCHREEITGQKLIPLCPLVLVEGVYSLHPLYRDAYTLRLFLHTSPQTQDARLRARGDWLYERFQTVWLPLEKAYFASENWPELCDAVIET